MIRGTTPTLEFGLPLDSGQIEKAYVTFAQNDEVVFEKQLHECKCAQNKLTVTLTQEETLKLKCSRITAIQIRVKTVDGNALASTIIYEPTEKILKDGVI